jgi:hypothetical protein
LVAEPAAATEPSAFLADDGDREIRLTYRELSALIQDAIKSLR